MKTNNPTLFSLKARFVKIPKANDSVYLELPIGFCVGKKIVLVWYQEIKPS